MAIGAHLGNETHNRAPGLGAEREASRHASPTGGIISATPEIESQLARIGAAGRSPLKQPTKGRDEPKAEVAATVGEPGRPQGLSATDPRLAKVGEVQDIAAEQNIKAARQLANVAELYEQHVDRMLHARGQDVGGKSLDAKTDMLEVSTASLGNLPKVPDFVGHKAPANQGAEMTV